MARKNDFITAFCWLFGGSKRNAAEAYRNAAPDYITTIIECFQGNAARVFSED